MSGVEIQANLAQQIIDIARNESFPISAWKEPARNKLGLFYGQSLYN